MEFNGGESTIRRTVRSLKSDYAFPPQAMIPLSYTPGEAMQIDWGMLSNGFENRRTWKHFADSNPTLSARYQAAALIRKAAFFVATNYNYHVYPGCLCRMINRG